MRGNMAQEQSCGVRRRNLESPMKESQARTKVVLRHLPPTISQAVVLEFVDAKYAGCYTWFSFRPGKASPKKQVFSRAYINFKRPEDVYDFYEDVDGHVFLNERGTPYKLIAEYAPYQRIPKPRSKKDIREGTITKDPDYLEFLEMLGKPLEYLPSAEVQLERREAEKAAALVAGGGKESVVVTPLMEFVRQRRAAKAAPQRSLSSKLGARSGSVTVVTSSLASHKRCLERSRSGPLVYGSDSSMSVQKDSKEVPARDYGTRHQREDQQHRKERSDMLAERRKKELAEIKEKKIIHEHAPVVISSSKGSALALHLESSKDSANVGSSKDSDTLMDRELAAGEDRSLDVQHLSASLTSTGKFAISMSGSLEGVAGDLPKDLNKREVVKRKQLIVMKEKPPKDMDIGPTSPGQPAASGYSLYNQRHRPPLSPRVTLAGAQPQLAPASGEGGAGASKLGQRRDISGKSSSRGALSPREQQSPSQQHAASQVVLLVDSHGQSQHASPQSERVGKRPPRPQNTRLTGKEQSPAPSSPVDTDVASPSPLVTEEKISNTSVVESFPANDRQDSRRVRNKDRPDRPVWTPRRRADTAQSTDSTSVPSVPSASPSLLAHADSPVSGHAQVGCESVSKHEKTERAPNKFGGRAIANVGPISGENKTTELYLGTGQQPDGGKTQSGSGPPGTYNSLSGKARYVESGSTRSSRGPRAVAGNALSVQEQTVSNQVEQRSDSSLPVTSIDTKPQVTTIYNARENGESHPPSMTDKEKRKQDSSPVWNELSGASHRSSDRRRERNVQHGSRDNDGGVTTVELNKSVKRGGNPALGSNEKQVWVAVQKSGSGT